MRSIASVIRTTALVWAVPIAARAQSQTLKDVFKNDFLVGAALNPRQFFETDAKGAALIKAQFNTISPENSLKWEVVHPQLGRYDFTDADQFVAFGEKNKMFTVGHTLVWHSQTPRWVFQDSAGQPLTRDALLARMHDHIRTVVGRYKGRIRGWDVVNEALNEDGTMRKSPEPCLPGPRESLPPAQPTIHKNRNDIHRLPSRESGKATRDFLSA